MKKVFFLIFISFLFFSHGFSQQSKFKDTKNIYLLDVTLSMFGYDGAPNIFDNVRTELINSINSIQNPGTEIVVLTFQDKILEKWSAFADESGKATIIKHLNDIDKADLAVTFTNIYDAWKEGRELINPEKLNVIYLLTDGVQNTSKPSNQDLYNEVSNWGGFARNNDYYAFLVELVDAAKDEKLREVIKKTPNAQVITGIDFFVLSVNENYPIISLYDDLVCDLDFIGDRISDVPKDFNFTINIQDENFDLQQSNFKLSDRPFLLELNPRNNLSSIKDIALTEWFIALSIDFDQEKYPNIKLLNNNLQLKIKNQKEMVLQIKVLEN